MQNVQRRFGRLLTRSADEAQVSVLMKDFEDADRMLTKIVDATKAWRDAWASILTHQFQLVNEIHGLYTPIVGASEAYPGHDSAAVTPRSTLERTSRLRDAYQEMKTDLLEEVNLVDTRIIKPAMDAKDFIQPLKKTIKKREDKKLDFERYQGRVDTSKKKLKRSDRENISLAKSEVDLARALEEYHAADDHLKSTLPPLISAAFAILPHILAAQVMTQNTLLGQYYTILHGYCQDERFPSPPPPMQEVISAWDADFKPLQYELETGINCIARGKAVQQSMKMEDQIHGGSVTGLNIRNGFAQRRASSQTPLQKPSVSPHRISPGSSSPELSLKPKIGSLPSPSSSAMLSPPTYPSGAMSNSPKEYQTPNIYSHSPAGPRADYFSRDRNPSSSSISSSAAAAKKKPPPPPPVKRFPSNQGIWVTAQYDFEGQSGGDLNFKEGDKIKVIKKTDSLEDWWEGELHGIKGSFPANYCKA
ncbi:MAG: hypothetical protein M1827_004505 [Pycnora praestabilis]|nr:MAG: hypothetical protein M1827_004505 [Pycnora praestabilis]